MTIDYGNVSSTSGVDAAGSAAASETWSVDKNNRTITLDNGYTLSFDNSGQSWHLRDKDGNEAQIWGDPHVAEDDGGKWDFKATTTFMLDDGTKITCNTKPVGDGSVTVSDKLTITKGDQCIEVTGIAEDNVQIGDVTTDGAAKDRAVSDGYVVTERGGVDDWNFNGEEIQRNMPFEDYGDWLDQATKEGTAPKHERINPLHLPEAAREVQTNSRDFVDGKLEDLRADMEARVSEYRERAEDSNLSVQQRNQYKDLVNALEGDLQELQGVGADASTNAKAKLYNRLSKEMEVEIKYNVNITNDGTPFSERELKQIDAELSKLPADFTVDNDNLREIRNTGKMKANEAGDSDRGVIKLAPGQIKNALVHEIGVDYAANSAQMDEFMNKFGWEDATDHFASVSTDYNASGAYDPFHGSATAYDGRVYRDGDLMNTENGQKKVNVQYGKVYLSDPNAKFVTPHAGTSPENDFAACLKAFAQDPQSLMNVSPEKYQFMVDMLGTDPLAKARA